MPGARVGIGGVVGVFVFGAVVACGGSSASTVAPGAALEEKNASPDGGGSAVSAAAGDSGAPTGSTTTKPKRPQLVSGGGKVLAAPKVQLIRYQGDALADTAESFVKAVGASAWWAATTKEYGVSGLTVLPSVTLEAPAQTIDDQGIQAFLVEHLGAADGLLEPPTDDTLYVLVAPESVKITVKGETGCDSVGGYHSEVDIGGGRSVPYVVVPRCATFLEQSGAAELTFTLGHELVEAALDPKPDTAPAFHLGAADLPWRVAYGDDEAADLCAFPQNAITPPGLGFTVPRSWSNAAVAAGRFPCVPADGVVDIFAEPDEPDTVEFRGTSYPAVKIARGQSRTIAVHLASSGPTEDFTIKALDAASALAQLPPELDVSFADGTAMTTGRSGDSIQLKITALAQSTPDTSPSELVLAVISKDEKVATLRPLLVGH